VVTDDPYEQPQSTLLILNITALFEQLDSAQQLKHKEVEVSEDYIRE
jgi:hypothetical protein